MDDSIRTCANYY